MVTPLRSASRVLALVAILAGAAGLERAAAQTMPTIDTEDVDLGGARVGEGRFHPILTLDIRNGDFARGGYDDDAASLDRVPVHVALGFGYELHLDEEGEADAWLVFRSSNGLHASVAAERDAPRSWYESNNVLGVVVAPVDGLQAGLAYTIKTSPNGISGTSHEASVTAVYETDGGVGRLSPSFAATIRPKGDGGGFTQLGISPGFDLTTRAEGPSISVPVKIGVGWDGFYGPGTGDVLYGFAGLAYAHPFDIGATRWTAGAEALAVYRDDTLRRLGDLDAEHSTIVPLVTVSLTLAY